MEKSSVFSIIARGAGVSVEDLVTQFNVDPHDAEDWLSGQTDAPDLVFDEVCELAEQAQNTAESALNNIVERLTLKHGRPDVVELGYSITDHEARSIDWPSASVHAAAIGHMIAIGARHGFNFSVVPRGSTLASQEAVRAHEEGRAKS